LADAQQAAARIKAAKLFAVNVMSGLLKS